MDNDILINQARQLYAELQVKRQMAPSDRIDRLVSSAYRRYQRRLNSCAVCYQTRINDCDRFVLGKSCSLKRPEPELLENPLSTS